MKILKTLINSLIVLMVVLAGSLLSGTNAFAVDANQGVAMQVKVRLKLADGTIINNPPTEIRISWDSNPEDPVGDGCNNSSGSLLFAANNPSQGQPVPEYNGASWMLYREGGTREAAVWAQTEDNNGNLTNNWDWIGRGGASVGPCTCVHRRATVTLNGQTQTKEFVQRGTGITGGPFNNGATTIAEFDFEEPGQPTPTIGGTVSIPELGDLTIDAGSGAKGVGGSQSAGDVTNSNPKKRGISGKRASFDGGNFYNPLDITQKIVESINVSYKDSIDYVGVAFGHAANGGLMPDGSVPFPTSNGRLNAFNDLKQFVAVPPTSTPTGPGLILLYAYNTIDPSEDDLFTNRINPRFEAENYYVYLPEGLNSDESFGQWYIVPANGSLVNIPGLASGNSVISCDVDSSSPTCYLRVRKGIAASNDPDAGSVEWEVTIFPKMGSSSLTEVSFLKPKGQNKTIYKIQPSPHP